MRDNASICILYADNIHNTITYAVWYVRTCILYPISILCFIRFNIIIIILLRMQYGMYVPMYRIPLVSYVLSDST